jgi:hypothetical protein
MLKLTYSVKVLSTTEELETTKFGTRCRRRNTEEERIPQFRSIGPPKLVSLLSLTRFYFSCSRAHCPFFTDLRNYRTFSSLVNRLLQPDLASSPHVRFVNADRSPFWGTWQFDSLPVNHLRTCEYLEMPWQCDAFCRGVEDLKRGPIDQPWPDLKEIDW